MTTMTHDEAVRVLRDARHGPACSDYERALDAAIAALSSPPAGMVLAGYQVRECHPWDVRKPEAWSAWEQASDMLLDRIKNEGSEFDAATHEVRAIYAAAPPPSEPQGGDVRCEKCSQPTFHVGRVCYACSHPSPAEQGGREELEITCDDCGAVAVVRCPKCQPAPGVVSEAMAHRALGVRLPEHVRARYGYPEHYSVGDYMAGDTNENRTVMMAALAAALNAPPAATDSAPIGSKSVGSPAEQGGREDGPTSKESWWAGARVGLGVDESMPRTEVAAMLDSRRKLAGPVVAGEVVKADDVKWIVNDNAELGVMIHGRAFFLYKGESLEYTAPVHDDGTPMLYRMVGKREFGECCHPVKFCRDGARLPERYTEPLVYTPGLSFGKPEDGDWRPLVYADTAKGNGNG